MSRKESLPNNPVLHRELAQFDFPLEHSFGYRWGSLSVTESAYQAYGMIPLKADLGALGSSTAPHEQFDMPKGAPRVDVLVVGPDQWPEDDDQEADMNVLADARLDKGINVIVGFSKDTEAMGTIIKHDLLEDEEDADSFEFREFEQNFDHNMPQMVGHILPQAIGSAVSEAVVNYLGQLDGRNLKRRVRRIGYTTLGIAGIMVGLDSFAGSRLNGVAVAVPTVYAGAFGVLEYRLLKQYLSRAELSEQVFRQAATVQAAMIASDIHLTYCARHFDKKAEEQLNGDN